MVRCAVDHCEMLDDMKFENYCVSLKDSDSEKVIDANRRFALERPDVPLHLGVTEAGLPPEGIIKTRIAFEQLISAGIGDTIRVSLTLPNDDKGQEIDVMVLDVDPENKRISLGLKQLTDHPWENLGNDIQEGSKISGKVVVIADYGAFVEIKDGIEGLVHVSEMSWSTHLRSAQDFVNVGDSIEAVVLTLDRESRKMSLGIKQLTQDNQTNTPETTQNEGKNSKPTMRTLPAAINIMKSGMPRWESLLKYAAVN